MKTLATMFTAVAVALLTATPAAHAQSFRDSISTGPGNQMQVFYNMETGVVQSAALSSWDIAFEVTGFTSSILTNGGAGVALYAVPGKTIDNWSETLDTTGIKSWAPLNNSIATWTSGAFNMGSDPNSGNFGWGEYNMITHVVTGTTLYVVSTPTDGLKKIMIEGLAARKYTFRFANLDGSDEVTGLISKDEHPGKQFAYYSFAEKKTVEVAPSTATWDLVFGKYIAFLGPDGSIPYGVTGVLANEGVQLAQVHGTDATTAPLPSAEQFTDSIGLIGYDWKAYNGQGYTIDTNTAFFVHAVNGNYYRVRFTGFGGGSTGKIYFDRTAMETSNVKANDGASASFAMYPSLLAQGQSLTVAHSIMGSVNSAAIEIYDMRGVLCYSNAASTHNGTHTTQIAPELTAGSYLVSLTVDGNRATQRLIVH